MKIVTKFTNQIRGRNKSLPESQFVNIDCEECQRKDNYKLCNIGNEISDFKFNYNLPITVSKFSNE